MPTLRAASLLCLFVAAAADAQPAAELKLASHAPATSSWAAILTQWGQRVAAETHGRVKLRFSFSHAGDELDMVRQMNDGRLDGATLTMMGIHAIAPASLVLALPHLFTSDEQVDRVRQALASDFEKLYDDAGYVLLGWSDEGWVHTFSTVKLETREQVAAASFWEWAEDPFAHAYLEALGGKGVRLVPSEVLAALDAGRVQAIYGPPLVVVAMQWYSAVKYMSDRPSSYWIGALVIRKKAFDRLAPEDQRALTAAAREAAGQLTANGRGDYRRAIQAMLGLGIQSAHVAAGKQGWERLAGKLCSKAWLAKVVETAR
jgi:TRAP-type transport system periplasmic protein